MSQEIIDRLKSQILSQGTTDKWSGEGFGSAEANAKNMAEILSGIGITDIRQFGQIDKYEPVEQIGFQLNGQSVQNPRPGMYYVQEPAYDGEGGLYYTRRDLTPEEAAQVKPVYGVVTGYDEYMSPTYRPVDATNVTTKDGKLVGVTGQTFGNKVTGQAVPVTYSERQTGNAWGGTFAGKGNTGYRVEFAPDGTPYFYTTGASSSDKLLSTLAPALGLGLMAFPGVGTALGTALGASGTAATAIGNAIVQGTLAEATGGDFLKGAATGALTSVAPSVSSTIAEAAGGGMLGAALGQGLTSAGTAAILGGDATQAGILGALTGAASYTPPDLGMNSPLTMAQIESGLGTEGYGYGAQAAASGLFNPAVIGSQAYPPEDLGLNSPITMAQIESGLGTPGYGYGAQAAESGLFEPEVIGSGAYTTTEGFSPVPQVPEIDPYEVGGALGPDNIDVGGGYNTAMESPLPEPSQIPWDKVGKLLGGLFTLSAAPKLTSQPTVQQPVISAYSPVDTVPVYSPEYFQQVQQYYNTYLPTTPRDVASPLQDWYSSGYEQPDSVTARLFPNGV